MQQIYMHSYELLLWQQFITVLTMGLKVFLLTLSLLVILMVITCYTSQWRAITRLDELSAPIIARLRPWIRAWMLHMWFIA